MKLNKKESQPHWHPNFVNAAKLPDIKVVRTNFIVNGFAVLFAVGAIFLIGQREYKAKTLESTIARLEERIGNEAADDAEYLRISKEFKKAAEYIIEVSKFSETPFFVHDLVVALIQIKPEDLIYRSLSISEMVEGDDDEAAIIYRVNLAGDAKSLTVLDQFKGTLARTEALQFSGFRIEIDETLEGRDAQTGVFPYRLSLSFIPDASQTEKTEEAS